MWGKKKRLLYDILRLFLSAAIRMFPVLSSLQISDGELLHWKELVAKCMTEYHSSECNKPDNKKLVWIVSRRTAQNLQANHFSVPGLPTIPEGSWDESERLVPQSLQLNGLIKISVCFFSFYTGFLDQNLIKTKLFVLQNNAFLLFTASRNGFLYKLDTTSALCCSINDVFLSRSDDSYEDMSCGEYSPCGSPGSDGEGAFFPSTFLRCRK